MEISVDNFLGIQSAKIALRPGVNLIAGLNGSGKTSICLAIAQIFNPTGKIPVTGYDGKTLIAKNESMVMVHRGNSHGEIRIKTSHGTVTMPIPSLKPSGKVTGKTDELSLGILTWSSCDRKSVVGKVMESAGIKTLPTEEDFFSVVPRNRLSVNYLGMVAEYGWDHAWTAARSRVTELKGAWQAITGEVFGGVKAKTWKPNGWTDDLIVSRNDLVAAKEAAIEAHAEAVANEAMDGRRKAELMANAGKEVKPAREIRLQEIDKLTSEIKACQERMAEESSEVIYSSPGIDREIAEIDKIYKRLESEGKKIECKSCGSVGILSTDGSKLIAVSGPDVSAVEIEELKKKKMSLVKDKEAEIRDRKQKMKNIIDSHYLAAAPLEKKLSDNKAALTMEDKERQEIEEAKKELASYGNGTISADEVIRKRDQITVAENRLALYDRFVSAESAAAEIELMTPIVEALSPNGLRNKKMAQSIGQINNDLRRFSDAAGWPSVEIADHETYGLVMGGIPFRLLSGSEKWRANAVVAGLNAIHQKHDIIILDAADILTGKNRSGLVKMINGMLQNTITVIGLACDFEYFSRIRCQFQTSHFIENGRIKEGSPPFKSGDKKE
ncbi:MAG: AAA family ATPase [Magnetococcus sp. THC-1_WYH]